MVYWNWKTEEKAMKDAMCRPRVISPEEAKKIEERKKSDAETVRYFFDEHAQTNASQRLSPLPTRLRRSTHRKPYIPNRI